LFHPHGQTLAIRAQREFAIRVLDLDTLEAELGRLGMGWSTLPTTAADMP
jgi:hypothetical protein